MYGGINIKERFIEVIDSIDLTYPQLERRTGIKAVTWRNLKHTTTRVNEDHIEGLKKLCPQYLYWVMTGKTIPEAGQISPKLEETKQKLGEAG